MLHIAAQPRIQNLVSFTKNVHAHTGDTPAGKNRELFAQFVVSFKGFLDSSSEVAPHDRRIRP